MLPPSRNGYRAIFLPLADAAASAATHEHRLSPMNTLLRKRIPFSGKLVMVGFGSIGQAVLPLLLRHLSLEPQRIRIVKTVPDATGLASGYGVQVTPVAITRANMEEVLVPLREQMLALRNRLLSGPTALVTQGANPGLISALLKQALLNLAAEHGFDDSVPVHREGWAGLARRLDVRVIHVAERDTQAGARRKKRGEFVNTWSIEGFVDEGLQPAELGWGSHEKHWPADAARHGFGCGAAIFLQRPGIATRVRSWTPLEGRYHGFLVTHAEAISIADYYTIRDHEAIAYRPTVLYAYRPCDDAVLSLHEIEGDEWRRQDRSRLLRDEIDEGADELGILLMGPRTGAYWYGSRLSIAQARALAPYNNATTLQVVAGILGGIAWMVHHPEAGIVEPDEIDHRVVLQMAQPYLGDVVGVAGDWTPLRSRNPLYDEPIDPSDPWQFVNFRVAGPC